MHRSVRANHRVRRVAIVFWEGHLSIAPSMVSAMELLAQAGYEVDVLVRGADEELPPLGPVGHRARILKAEFAGRISSETARKGIRGSWRAVVGSAAFFGFVLQKTIGRDYDAIFGIDGIGGACGEFIASIKGVPFFYWSLELAFAQDLRHPLKKILKLLERRALRRAAWIVVQDRLREEALLMENRPGHQRTLLVPNAPAGHGSTRPSQLLHQKLNVPESERLVLHAGMLDPEVMALELATSARDWPPGYSLVLHSNYWKPLDDPYVSRIVALNEPRVYLSNHPVPVDELDDLISSARIGLATYRDDLGPNYSLIVSASGKIPYYLRNGVPVICSDLPGMAELMRTYGCGVTVRTVDEIPDAIRKIESSYDSFRAGALHCYERRYEFSVHFRAVLNALGKRESLGRAAA